MSAARARVLLLGVALAAPPAARAGEVPLPPPASAAWRPLPMPRIERRTAYAPERIDGVDAVRAESECAASALVLPVDDVDLHRTPLLRWRWRVDRGLDLAHERTKAGDDFAARVYVLFRFDPARASLFERLRHALGRRLFDREPPGAALNYVWTSREPAGARWSNPYLDASKMLSLGPGPEGVWRDAQADVLRDAERAFGGQAPALAGVALMTDSDDSCGRASAAFADLRFAGRDE